MCELEPYAVTDAKYSAFPVMHVFDGIKFLTADIKRILGKPLANPGHLFTIILN